MDYRIDWIFQSRVTSWEFQILYKIYVPPYPAGGWSTCSEESGFCFSIFLLSWDTKQNKHTRNDVDCKEQFAIITRSELRNKSLKTKSQKTETYLNWLNTNKEIALLQLFEKQRKINIITSTLEILQIMRYLRKLYPSQTKSGVIKNNCNRGGQSSFWRQQSGWNIVIFWEYYGKFRY